MWNLSGPCRTWFQSRAESLAGSVDVRCEGGKSAIIFIEILRPCRK